MAQCTALRLSDEQRCDEPATSLNGLFCGLHSRQCQGLYRGYKLRNARLDRLVASPPEYITEHATPLANMTFGDVEGTASLQEIHNHLFQRYALLDRVIRARKLHHSRFFSLELDYGHQHFLDKLQSDRTTVIKALARLEKRAVQLQHQQSAWYGWIKDCQSEEEAHREQEKKKVKQAAEMFKRHRQLAEKRAQLFLQKEHAKRQEEYLDQAHSERLSQEEQEAAWDPTEDVIEDERGNYVDLIQQFLWLVDPVTGDIDATLLKDPTGKVLRPRDQNTSKGEGVKAASASAKGRKKAKKGPELAGLDATVRMTETKNALHARLVEGTSFHPDSMIAGVLVGSRENPEIRTKIDPLSDEEAASIVTDLEEVKKLLFCRTVLSHAALLPLALKSDSIQAFLQNEEITETDLRDLALRLDQPTLQDIRDACADLVRNEQQLPGSDPSQKPEDPASSMQAKDKPRKLQYPQLAPKRELPNNWQTMREMQMAGGLDSDGFKGFGPIDDQSQYQIEAVKVQLCGRSIWRYPSGKPMARGGWLQFCALARDSKMFDAMHLCRHWDEFYELSVLAMFHYFPASRWSEWVGDRSRQSLLTLGLAPYFQNERAEEMTINHQTGSRGLARRSHAHFESRNFICAYMKRDDPASRRFIEYLAMWSTELVALVRDVKTGNVVVRPPESEGWLIREKSGYGRASRNEWNVLKKVGPEFTEEIEKSRRWHLGFQELYDIVIWEREPGQIFDHFFNVIQKLLIRAHRCRSMLDIYRLTAPILETLVTEPGQIRARDIRPDDQYRSIWHEISGNSTLREVYYDAKTGRSHHFDEDEQNSERLEYFDAVDEAEDEELFRDRSVTNAGDTPDPKQAMESLEGPPNWDRFIMDLDPEEEMPDSENEGEDWSETDSEASFDSKDGEVIVDEDQADGRGDNGGKDPVKGKKQTLQVVTRSEDDPSVVETIFEGIASKEFLDFFDSSAQKARASEDLYDWTIMEKPDIIEDPSTAFWEWLDCEKAFKFKNCWHAADLEEGAQERWRETKHIREAFSEAATTHDFKRWSYIPMQTLIWLDVLMDSTRRERRDAGDAAALVSLFFPARVQWFFDLEEGAAFKDSLLIKQDERAKQPCKRRTNYSLYKAGIICSHYKEISCGQAVAATEPGRPSDLFFDYQAQIPVCRLPPTLQNPNKLDNILSKAQRFAKKHSGAKFAALRLWSAPHFYPLMIGYDNRVGTSFHDCIGRIFAWRFMPKDMPYSEYSIHKCAADRILPFKSVLQDRVYVKQDLILVMGLDEEDLFKYAVATVFAIQTRPWRAEVDFWRSFVNVDIGFLEALDKSWVE